MKAFLPLALLLLLCSCDPAPDTSATEELDVLVEETDPYAERVAAARQRLYTGNEAAQLVWRATEAHGGLAKWYAAGPLYYHFDYQPEPGEDGSPRNTTILNDYANARAVHTSVNEPEQQFGYDGEQAWSTTGEKVDGMSPRFWSLTPYYFVGLPFVLADEGINYELLPDAELDGKTYDMVKVTYEAGTGDAPDDYYVLYLDPDDGQLDALRYIVSYPGFFEDGKHLPEKLMKITGKTTVDGITLPTGYATHWWNEGQPSERITAITVSDYAFRPDSPEEAFAMPAGAKPFTDLPQ